MDFTININNTEYYLHKFPTVSYAEQLVHSKAKLYIHSNTDDLTLGFISYLNGIQQPNDEIIQKALFWSYEGYSIKVGCGNTGIGFQSSLTIPNDNDGDSVIIKKYGSCLNDVLITYNEVEELYYHCADKHTLKTVKMRNAIDMVKLYSKLGLANKKRAFIKDALNKSEFKTDAIKFWQNYLTKRINSSNSGDYNPDREKNEKILKIIGELLA